MLFGRFVATSITGMVAILAAAIVVLYRLRKHQLRQVNHQLDEILADSTIAKDGSFTKNL